LREEWRTESGVATVLSLIESLGIAPTATGAASISGRVEQGRFESLFGSPAETADGITIATPALPIPEALRKYVKSITVAPQHTFMK
jgi:hypothetical protein